MINQIPILKIKKKPKCTKKKLNHIPFNQNFYIDYCKKKPYFNILIFHRDIKVIWDFWNILFMII